MVLAKEYLRSLRKLVQVATFSFFSFVFHELQALVTEPALYYSASFGEYGIIQAKDPQKLVETYNRYMRIRFDECMSQAPPFSCVLLEINREYEAMISTNGFPNNITWYMRQTNVSLNQDLVSNTIVNENGLNYLAAKLVVECPYGVTPYVVSSHSDSDGALLRTSVCPFQEEIPEKCAVAGNPVNFLSGDKTERVRDFHGRGGLSLERQYVNQKVGWQIESLDFLIDLSRPKVDADPRACSGYRFFRSLQQLKFSSSNDFQPVSFEKLFCLDFVSPEQSVAVRNVPDVIIKFGDGRIVEFSYENGFYHSNVPGLMLRSVLANSPEDPSWQLVDESGTSNFFGSDGYLLRTQSADRRENLFYSYLNGKLNTKSNDYGDELKFHYDQNQHVQRVVLPGGSEVQYKFQPADSQASLLRLETVTHEDGQSIDYRYDDARFPLAITSMNDASGQVFSKWTYDEQGRAVSSERGSGKEKFTFDYSGIDDQKVSVTNPLGKRTTYSFETISGLQRIIFVEGHASPSCAARSRYRTYYANGTLQAVTDWESIVTYFERDEMGRVIRETRGLRWSGDPQYGVIPSGLSLIETPETYVKKTCWQSGINQPERIVEPHRIRVFDYDSQGRLQSLRIEPRTNTNASCL